MLPAVNPLLAFAAGALTILSPCVLPLLPIVFAGASRTSRFGPLALAGGLIVAFTGTGLALAALGTGAVAGGEAVQLAGAAMLLLFGLVLLIPALQRVIERAAEPLANWAAARQTGLEAYGLLGQAGIGALLGLVWSPCVGPTLGAATLLAAQGKDLAAAATVMAAFALGIALTLIAVSVLAKSLMARLRGPAIGAGARGRQVLGGVMALVALLILTGTDHLIEGILVSLSPQWLIELTTSI